MNRPTTRILALLELLQTHGRMSGPELARRLEVGPRTLRRYITTLEDIGIPITTERGRHGGYTLVSGFKLPPLLCTESEAGAVSLGRRAARRRPAPPPLMFTESEAVAVSLGLQAARGLGFSEAAPAVASALAKLERVMPADLKRRVRAIGETTTLDLRSGGNAGSSAALAALATAAQEQQRVQLAYQALNGATTRREIDPYGLVYWRGRWYVVGDCHLRQDLRSFRLDRVTEVRLSAARFTRPQGFDAAAYLKASIATIPRALAVEVLLKADLSTVLAMLPESAGVFEPTADGVLLRTYSDSLEWIARRLAALPCAFEVRAPDALRAAVRDHALRLLAMTERP